MTKQSLKTATLANVVQIVSNVAQMAIRLNQMVGQLLEMDNLANVA